MHLKGIAEYRKPTQRIPHAGYMDEQFRLLLGHTKATTAENMASS
jgi:hypothetical protein